MNIKYSCFVAHAITQRNDELVWIIWNFSLNVTHRLQVRLQGNCKAIWNRAVIWIYSSLLIWRCGTALSVFVIFRVRFCSIQIESTQPSWIETKKFRIKTHWPYNNNERIHSLNCTVETFVLLLLYVCIFFRNSSIFNFELFLMSG